MKIALLHRNRAEVIEGAVAKRIAGNAWEIRIPKDAPIHQKARRTPTPEGWDDAVLLLDDVETQPVLGSGEDDRTVWVTAIVLG